MHCVFALCAAIIFATAVPVEAGFTPLPLRAVTGSVPRDNADNARIFGSASQYFLYACGPKFQERVLDRAKQANIKVIRIFLVRLEPYTIQACQDGGASASVTPVPDVEDSGVGVYDDTILEMLDKFLYRAHQRDIKVTIAPHDRWSLGCWRTDAYVSKYHLPTSSDCGKDPEASNPRDFYSFADARADYKDRLKHILSFKAPSFDNRSLSELEEVIFSVDVENEALGHMVFGPQDPESTWVCEMAGFLHKEIAASGILVSCGGGGVGAPVKDQQGGYPLAKGLFSCTALDVVGLHSYDGAVAISRLLKDYRGFLHSGKRLFLQEFGCSADTSAAKRECIHDLTDIAIDLRVPWSYWQIGTSDNPDQLEISVEGPEWTALGQQAGISAGTATDRGVAWPEVWD